MIYKEETMLYLTVLFLSVLLTLMMKKLAIHDHPNERSAHTISVPTGGGLSIVVAFYLGLFMLFYQGQVAENLFYALLSGLVLVVVSFVDDIRELSPSVRMLTQLLSIMMAFYFLDIFSLYAWYQTLLFLLSSLWLINLYNFLDGIDGYAASEGVFVSLGAFVFYHDSLFSIMIFAIGGFLLFNWQKASIFMGDVGSTFLGFFFAVMAIYHYHDSADLLIWMILLGVFIFDASVTLFRRAINGEKLSQAHKKHAFQRLVQSGFSHQKTVLLAMGVNILCFVPLWFLHKSDMLILFFICYTIVLFLLLKIIDKKRSFI